MYKLYGSYFVNLGNFVICEFLELLYQFINLLMLMEQKINGHMDAAWCFVSLWMHAGWRLRFIVHDISSIV